MSHHTNVDAMSNKVRQIIKELESVDTSIGGCDLSSSFSDDSDRYDDKLSCVSDISSVASFELTPLKSKNSSYISKDSQKQYSKKNRSIPRQSRIPVPLKGKRAEKSKNSSGFKLAKPIRNPSPPPVEVPMNFLAPDLSDYSSACICIFEGTDFPRSRNGERSTYVVVQLHPELPPVRSPISFNKTTNAVYNGGFNLNVIGINFSSVVPVVEVFDFISEDQNELLGMAFLQLHMARKANDYCVVLQDEWIDIFTVNTRVRCGKIKLSLIFHNETDISQFVNRSEMIPKQLAPKPKKKEIEEPEKPVLESMAVQASVEPQIVNNSMMDNIGDLNISFNMNNNNNNLNRSLSSIKQIKFGQFDSPEPEKVRVNPFHFGPVRRAPIIIPNHEDENENDDYQIPEKQQIRMPDKPNIPVPEKKKEKVFVDENDLSSLSDLFSNSSSSVSTAQDDNNISVSSISKNIKSKEKKARVPLQPQINSYVPNPPVDASKASDIEKRKSRFIKYSDYCWDNK